MVPGLSGENGQETLGSITYHGHCMPCFDKVNHKSLESRTIGVLSGGMETKITTTLCLTSIKVDTNLQRKKKKKNPH